MNRIKDIKSFEDLKEFIILNKESIKKAALPLTVAAAILIFWISGLSSEEQFEESNSSIDEGIEVEQLNEKEDYDASLDKVDEYIYVDIGGCIKNPGVYKLDSGTRLFQLVERAGGLTVDADTENINQAEEVYDGQKIVIYSVNDNNNQALTDNATNHVDSTGKVNINLADSATLQQVPGIGPATASKIIEYREAIGRFARIEDIKNVSGIGDKTFENMKAYIFV